MAIYMLIQSLIWSILVFYLVEAILWAVMCEPCKKGWDLSTANKYALNGHAHWMAVSGFQHCVRLRNLDFAYGTDLEIANAIEEADQDDSNICNRSLVCKLLFFIQTRVSSSFFRCF